MQYYDLHIHSCLSPCASNDMTPNNIVNMALIKGLQCISVCDHNSMLNQKAILQCAKNNHLNYLIGVELQTKEEVHILAYFTDEKIIEPFQEWIEKRQSSKKNMPSFFGNQYVMDDKDCILYEQECLLIDSLNIDVSECIEYIHKYGGVAILAHAYGKRNGIITQLGFIPKDLKFDGIEIRNLSDISSVLENSPWIKNDLWLCSSDAHQLIDIHECEHTLTKEELVNLGGFK